MIPGTASTLDAWLGDRDDLTVVGDANQTIYSFAGASPQPLLNFGRRFPEAVVVRLEPSDIHPPSIHPSSISPSSIHPSLGVS